MPGKKDEELLKEIRKNFDYAREAWRENRAEGDIDMRIVAGKPWSEDELARRGKDRPALTFDETTQFVNQLVNNIKQNPRGIAVNPRTSGTDPKLAERRAALIRGIEEASVARHVRALAFEGACQRGEGYSRVVKQYRDTESFDQELLIKPITNPSSVLIDPDAREAAAMDMKWCFVVNSIRKDEFSRKYPDAEVKDFSVDMQQANPAWIKEESVQEAEYWCIKYRKDRLLALDAGAIGLESRLAETGAVYDDKAQLVVTPTGATSRVVKVRDVQVPFVTQYVTNGVEILATTPWEGRYIPVIPYWGRTFYYDSGAGVKFVVAGILRFARDPIKMLNYVRSSESELVSMLPKAPYVGVFGQFDGLEESWAKAATKPAAYLEYRARTTETGENILPPPARPQYSPDIAALQGLGEECRRAIMAATGMYQSSVGNRDSAGSSGIAIKELNKQSDQGNFHFIANFDNAVEHEGRIINDMIQFTYDTPREVPSVGPDGKAKPLALNDPQNPKALDVTEGDFDLTISVGPSFESERAEAREFVDSLVRNIPGIFERVGDLLVRLNLTGPTADELVKRLTPAEFVEESEIPPSVIAEMKQLQQALEAAKQEIETKQSELDSRERQTSQTNETKMAIAELQARIDVALKRMDGQVKLEVEAMKPEPVEPAAVAE